MGKKIVLQKGMGPHAIPTSIASEIFMGNCDSSNPFTLIDDDELCIARENESLVEWVELASSKTLEVFELPSDCDYYRVFHESMTTETVAYVSGGKGMLHEPDVSDKIKVVVVDDAWRGTWYFGKNEIVGDVLDYAGFCNADNVFINGAMFSKFALDTKTFEQLGFDYAEDKNHCYINVVQNRCLSR